jgi:capsular exopolysaccharide synthesis family protein
MAKNNKNQESENADNLVTLHHQKSPATEAFRTIRTNLQFMSPDKKLEVMMVTGSEAGIGKSTISSNLALTFSMTGENVFLIDTDMRKPRLHKIFGIPNFQGLSSYLSGEKDNLEELIIKHEETGTLLLPSGPIPPNPSEMLNSNKMEKLLKECRKKAEITIIDAPPLLPVTDAVLLSNKVDGVILVAETNKTKKEVFIKGKERLEQVNANILGTVLNKYPVNNSSYNTYENYYYYGEE